MSDRPKGLINRQVFILLHDRALNRTTNGQGDLAAMPAEAVALLDAGKWFGKRFAGTRVPTLDEVFEAVGKKLFINIEIKSNETRRDGIEQVVADCITRHNMQRCAIEYASFWKEPERAACGGPHRYNPER